MMPVSRKGRGQRKVTHQPVAIPPELARKLKVAAKGKPTAALLLPKQSGQPWGQSDHIVPIRKVCEATGLDITIYVLRHCSIVRSLLANVPIRVVAAMHDTSAGQIEATYSRHILHFSDTVARQGLLSPAPPDKDSARHRLTKTMWSRCAEGRGHVALEAARRQRTARRGVPGFQAP
jgi:hypothetical protein